MPPRPTIADPNNIEVSGPRTPQMTFVSSSPILLSCFTLSAGQGESSWYLNWALTGSSVWAGLRYADRGDTTSATSRWGCGSEVVLEEADAKAFPASMRNLPSGSVELDDRGDKARLLGSAPSPYRTEPKGVIGDFLHGPDACGAE
jgi:hypothetical protein